MDPGGIAIKGVRDARVRIAGLASRTPLLPLDLPGAPGDIYLKLECLQPIGSFKIRGAANAMAGLSAEELARGVVTASAGNMAQGVAWCARARGIPCTVIAPDTAPAAKRSAIERLAMEQPLEERAAAFKQVRFPAAREPGRGQ